MSEGQKAESLSKLKLCVGKRFDTEHSEVENLVGINGIYI